MRAYLTAGLLIEAFFLLKSDQVAEAVQAVDRAEAALEHLKPPLSSYERICLGATHAFFYALGRPSRPGQPIEPPGLREHADRAVAEIVEGIRMGSRFPGALEMIVQLLPDRPEIQLLLMDEHFPADPLTPESDAKDHDPSVSIGGATP
jgi:hypothetical protein